MSHEVNYESRDCQFCSGTGKLVHTGKEFFFFTFRLVHDCHVCKGSGQVLVPVGSKPCQKCGGGGIYMKNKFMGEITVYILEPGKYPLQTLNEKKAPLCFRKSWKNYKCPACTGKGWPFRKE